MSDEDRPEGESIRGLSGGEKRALLQQLLQQSEGEPRRHPLSFAQERLWFLDELQEGNVAYVLASAFRLQGSLDAAALRDSLYRVSRRHEVLQTRFEVENDAPVQIVDPSLTPRFQEIDLAELDVTERDDRVRRLAQADARTPFDLRAGPLMRATLIRLGSAEAVLLIAMHHIISDGVSINLLVKDVAAFYRAAVDGTPVGRPDLPIQYGDFARWQREELTEAALDELMNYWTDALSAAPAHLNLPTDHPRPPVQTSNGGLHRLPLSKELTEAVDAFAEEAGTTSFMTLLTAFYVLLQRYTSEEDLVVGTPVANRRRKEVQHLVGFFVNTLVLRQDVSGRPSFRELLARVRRTTADAYDHRDVPFAHLVQQLSKDRSLSRQSLFQVMFSVRNTPPPLVDLPRVDVSRLDVEQNVEQFDLNARVVRTESGFEARFSYNRDLFEPTTIERMARHFQALLADAVRHPDWSVDTLDVLPQDERRRLLEDWNDTDRTLPADATLPSVLHAPVDRHPDAVALVDGSTHCTYDALNRRANRLAHALRRQDVSAGSRVGIFLPRSVDLVVALLGTLKAGAAYLPLDPTYPSRRLQLIVEEAAPDLILTGTAQRPEVLPKDARCLHMRSVEIRHEMDTDLDVTPSEQDLAYVIYTSGSTGRPKGVMVPHRAVVNFMAGMDERIGTEPGTWLAVTTVSFDISVLELLWTFSRGFRTILHASPRREVSQTNRLDADTPEQERPETDHSPHESFRDRALREPNPSGSSASRVEFGLFYFANDPKAESGNPYRLLMEGAKFADEHRFSAIWTPERHFDRFGGLYPNPSVTGSAVAAVTDHIDVRAGSVVLPLHPTVRVAEEWAVIDVLSGGRAGVSFASGWHPDDFVFAPDRFGTRRDITFEEMETVRRLWRGGTVTQSGVGGNPVEITLHPQPVQPELPVWITSGGNPDTFRRAGEHGAFVLTHLLGQTLDELAEKIEMYRAAWTEAGHPPEESHVSLMVHTFVGRRDDHVREVVRGPFIQYLRRSLGLLKKMAPEHLRGDGNLTEDEVDTLAEIAFERYYETSGLMGTVDTCRERVVRLSDAGVDEIACLIDFGVDTDQALDALRLLAEVKESAPPKRHRGSQSEQRPTPSATAESSPSRERLAPARAREAQATEHVPVYEQIRRHGVTHLQCTPSMGLLLTLDDRNTASLRELDTILFGGEPFADVLTERLRTDVTNPPRLLNMYGPTETTIWSTTHELECDEPTVPIGTPISNTQVHVVDDLHCLAPETVPGELWIGGEGVVRGYLEQPRETAQRFVPDPFGTRPGARVYRTGDRVRRRPDGTLTFLGRRDHQVKVRGHRVELGEVEAALEQHESVQEAVATVRGDGADVQLVAYVIAEDDRMPVGDGVPAGSNEQPTADLPSIATDRVPWTHPKGEDILREHPRYRLADGRVIAHQRGHVTSGLYQEVFQTQSYLRHGISVQSSDTVFDVGANIGMFTLFAETLAPGVTVHAFEPIPETCSVLRANVELHGIDATVHEVGLARKAEHVSFTYYPNSPGLSSRFADAERDRGIARTVIQEGWNAQTGASETGEEDSLPMEEIERMLEDRFRHRTVTCKTQTLSAVLETEDVETVDLLKIDVERGEAEVLAGLEAEDWKRIRQIVAEVDTEDLLTTCQALLDRHGFAHHSEPLVVTGRSEMGEPRSVYMLYATRDPAQLRPESASSVPIAWRTPPRDTASAIARDTASHREQDTPDTDASSDLPIRLRHHARTQVPTYMVPDQIVVLGAFPMTPNGKVDRARLPDVNVERSPDAPLERVDGSVEEAIETAWKEVLEVDQVGAHDNFFERGGTSLQMALVHRRLAKTVDAELSLVDLFQFPTVRSLAGFVDAGATDGDDPDGDDTATSRLQSRIEKRRRARTQ